MHILTEIDGRMIAIDTISGIFDHSERCMAQIEMDRNPPVALHPELREYALSLLRESTPLYLLRFKCATWAKQKWSNQVGDSQYRFQLSSHDSSSLYRTIASERGILQRTLAEDNLDRWFQNSKPVPPSPLLSTSCLHYQAHAPPATDRFEIIIVMPEMKEAAWKYAHKKQVLMDLTFGFCSARSLLLILLAFGDNGEGIPIAFIIFTARDSAKAVHADYNTAVLTRLLGIYKDTMGLNSLGESLIFAVGNTDNDPRERSALTTHWPDISLLLCIFHIWQAWRNKLNRSLAPIPKGTDRQSVRSRLGKFLSTLLKDISEYNEARKLYHEEVEYWTKLGKK